MPQFSDLHPTKRDQCDMPERSGHEVLAAEDGSGLVEFAVSAMLLYTLIFGIMDCSRALYVDHFLANAAREGTRYAMVHGGSWTSACSTATSYACTATNDNVQIYVQGLVSAGINATSLTVITTWPGSNANGTTCSHSFTNLPGCMVAVKVSYPFTFVSPLLPRTTLIMTSSADGTITQ